MQDLAKIYPLFVIPNKKRNDEDEEQIETDATFQELEIILRELQIIFLD